MIQTLSLHMWLSLDNETRHKLRLLFSIPRSSNTVVNDGKIESDGTTNEDIQHLTIKKMQDFVLSNSEDMHQLLNAVLNKINNPDPVGAVIALPEVKLEVKKKSGRPKIIKNA